MRPAAPQALTSKTILAAVLSLTAVGFVAGLVLLRARATPNATGSSLPVRAASTSVDTAVVVGAPSAEPSSPPAASATPAPSASASVAPKRKRTPAVVNGFQSFNTGRK